MASRLPLLSRRLVPFARVAIIPPPPIPLPHRLALPTIPRRAAHSIPKPRVSSTSSSSPIEQEHPPHPSGAAAAAATRSSSSSSSATRLQSPAERQQKRQEPRPERPSYHLAFTCKPCGTRSAHTVSKQAYHHGSTLITCPKCQSRHVISDHLGIFGDRKMTVEEILREKGELVRKGTLGPDGDIEFWVDERGKDGARVEGRRGGELEGQNAGEDKKDLSA